MAAELVSSVAGEITYLPTLTVLLTMSLLAMAWITTVLLTTIGLL